MRVQDHRRRDSKSFLIVDEDTGIPTSVVETYQAYQDNGPLAQSDPRSLLLSMSENSKSQNFNVYGELHPPGFRRPRALLPQYTDQLSARLPMTRRSKQAALSR